VPRTGDQADRRLTPVRDPIRIELPLAYLGSVNVWLLLGEPLTLIDTGAATDEDLSALEAELAHHGVAVEQLELILLTHHHLDHSGLATTLQQRSGAEIGAHRTTASWGVDYRARADAEQAFTRALMAAHGVPEDVIDSSDDFFAMILANGRPFETDRVLVDGDRVIAGGRTLRVVHRPGHSTTDTLFVDEGSDDAYVGDHLLANITSGVELMPTDAQGAERRQGLAEYLGNLRKTEVMSLRHCYTGHGPTITNHRALIAERIAFHADRLERVRQLVQDGHRSAYDVARHLWSDETAAAQPVLVTWEVLGHLDLLVNRGTVHEEIDSDGLRHFHARAPVTDRSLSHTNVQDDVSAET
jgi:glyoxylase-like metal-dependent hydrolase (beta-lactamase superfamily II)